MGQTNIRKDEAMSQQAKNLPAITLEQAMSTISQKCPEEASVIQAAVRKDILALGTDEVFALRDSEGDIRAFKQSLTLSLENGGLVQPVPGGPYVVSAQGYEIWAEATGTSVVFPKEVLVDNEWKPNPCVIRDPANRRILCITARAVAWRFTTKGLPQVTDWTHNFDTPSYRLIDLLGKAKKYPQAFKLYPADMGKPDEPGTWANYPFDESTTLWVNTAHEEALTWFAQILNREKKAIDYAQTFARRNALKHISSLQKAPGPRWTFPVICWRTTGGNIVKWDHTQYAILQDKAGSLANSTGEEFGTPRMLTADRRIELVIGSDRASDDETIEVLERLTDPEDQVYDLEAESTNMVPDADPNPPEADVTPFTDEQKKVMTNYLEAVAIFPDEYARACAELKLNPKQKSKRTVEQASAIMAKISAYIDQEARA